LYVSGVCTAERDDFPTASGDFWKASGDFVTVVGDFAPACADFFAVNGSDGTVGLDFAAQGIR
jgi:hypothetical protein